jgi:nucleolar protein 58
VEEQLKEAAIVSMGTDVSKEDLACVSRLASEVVHLMEYRAQLWAYLQARMNAIAPNLTVMVGELVGARLIAHAGSLMNLAKQPASTVQILGAEKALFRALKTKHDTPKYGLIYHASLIGQAPPKHKGKISRVLAAKTALSIRVDAMGDSSEPTIAIEARAKVEARMRQLEVGSRAGASGAPKARKSEGGGAGGGGSAWGGAGASASASARYNPAADVHMGEGGAASAAAPAGKAAKRAREEEEPEAEAEEEAEPRKKDKKEKKEKSEKKEKKEKKQRREEEEEE